MKGNPYNVPEDADVGNFRSISAGSTKQLVHYAQTSASNSFSQFDYGLRVNLQKYGQKYAPVINLAKLDVPLAMFVGMEDDLSTPDMGKWTLGHLSSKPFYRVIQNWDHSSFAIGKDMSYVDDVLALLNTYK